MRNRANKAQHTGYLDSYYLPLIFPSGVPLGHCNYSHQVAVVRYHHLAESIRGFKQITNAESFCQTY